MKKTKANVRVPRTLKTTIRLGGLGVEEKTIMKFKISKEGKNTTR